MVNEFVSLFLRNTVIVINVSVHVGYQDRFSRKRSVFPATFREERPTRGVRTKDTTSSSQESALTEIKL